MDNITKQINLANAEAAQADYQQILQEMDSPFQVNEALLLKILADNRDTEYGKKYDFANIKSYADYKRSVPIITYENINSDIERMLHGEENVLTVYPFNHMNETSGTVGKPKLIPMTQPMQEMFLKYNKHYMDALYLENYGEDWAEGRIFCTAQGQYRTDPSGITIGDASSKMAEYVQGGKQGLDSMLRAVYTSPVEATIPEPGTDTRYIHIRFAMMDKEIRGIVSGFFSMVVQYLHYITDNYEMLIYDIEHGTIDSSVEMPEEVRASLLQKIEPMPERAAELKEIFRNGSDYQFVPALWPKLRFLYGVGGDGFSVYTNTIRTKFTGDAVQVIYGGIVSSEGLWTIPVAVEQEASALAPGSGFMEFLPIEAGDDFSQIVTMDQLEVGKIYELIITNFSGFYRYRLSDAVQVTGFYRNTPLVCFMYRVNKTVNLAAEKTTETALLQTVERTAEELNFVLSDYTVYPDAEAVPARYVFLIQPEYENYDIELDTLAKTLNRHLREANHEYAGYEDAGRLGAAEAYWLQPQTTFLYRDLQVMKGRSAGQLKPLRIITKEQDRKFFFGLRDMR